MNLSQARRAFQYVFLKMKAINLIWRIELELNDCFSFVLITITNYHYRDAKMHFRDREAEMYSYAE